MTTTATRRHTVADFLGYGRRYRIDYRFPAAPSQPERAARLPIAQGRVETLALTAGAELVLSDLEVVQPYASRSRGQAALLIVVVMEGRVRLGTLEAERWLTAGEAFTLRLDERQILSAHQPAGQRLRTLSLALDEAAMHQWCGEALPTQAPSAWSLPNALSLTLEQGYRCELTGQPRRLLFQGLALQLLARGLAPPVRDTPQTTAPTASPGRRLEALRRLLEEAPEREHSLEALASRAAMSPSTLVRRFKAAYGCSPIDYLRRRRLARARELLLSGHSVQQAAHLSGYRHASNFITAFRRAYGVSPGSLASSRH
ncbi:helix-turn-helix transcriptional regulator [Halomonas salifodinae]|uniref:Helix-turn-helix transcriptional regulator n=1 Tax=Halomonas salifodinae TaxID=438745 RepID=A0ABW2ESB2_9GAMM